MKLIPIGIVYGTIVRLFMKHCDDYNSIKMEKNPLTRAHFLRVRRVNIATTLALTAPICTILLIKFGKLSLFDGLKIGVACDPNNALARENNELLNNLLPIFTYFSSKLNKERMRLRDSKRESLKKELPPCSAGEANKGNRTPNNGGKYPNILKIILFLIIIVVLYKYNIFTYISNNINFYFLCYIWFLILIFTIVYNSVGYLILLNIINIDLNKIRIKFIRNTIEDFIVIRNNTRAANKEKMKNYFISHLYLSFFLILLSGYFILF